MARRFYAIVDLDLDEIVFSGPPLAKSERPGMIGDEPTWVETMRVVMIDFAGPEPIKQYVS